MDGRAGGPQDAHRGHARRIFFGPQAQAVLGEFLPGRAVDAYLFSPAEAAAEMRARRGATRRTPLSCGNVPGSNRTDNPRRQPKGRYTVRSYEQAIERALYRAFPPPEPLARRRVAGQRGTRWETEAEWEARLGPAGWAELRAWRAAHHWHPHRLRHTAATNLRKAYGLEAAQVILGHRTLSTTQIYAEKDVAAATRIIKDVG